MFTKIKKILQKISITALITLLVLVIIGFGYEQISRQIIKNKYPAKGEMVDLGNGRKMQIDCRGDIKNGNLTVVLESGFDYYGSLSWDKVQDEIAKDTKICSYSRAGIMWSDPDTQEYNATNIASDLNLLLQKANITTPIIMAGHSLGGPFIMKYIQLFPNQVKGAVFVDTSHPDEISKGKILSKELDLDTTVPQDPPLWLLNFASEVGILRLFKVEQNAKDLLPEPLASIGDAYTPQSVVTVLKGASNIENIIIESGNFRTLGNIPIINLVSAKVIEATDQELEDGKWTREKFDNFIKKNQELKDSLNAERNTWSTNSKSYNVTDAEHFIHLDNPEIVIKSIKEVLESVQTGKTLK
jgi:pimeloyl-ACP methyl ester carboxylesterase